MAFLSSKRPDSIQGKAIRIFFISSPDHSPLRERIGRLHCAGPGLAMSEFAGDFGRYH